MKTSLIRIPVILSLLLFALFFTNFRVEAANRPPGKETRQEARMLKERGKKMQREGKDKLKEGRSLRKKHGNRKEARQLKREGRLLQKRGKLVEEEGRLLRQGKISPDAVQHRKRFFWMREENSRYQLR